MDESNLAANTKLHSFSRKKYKVTFYSDMI